jgi:proline iminopeptidase
MTDNGVVDRGGFMLEWVREGKGIPLLVLGSPRYYRRLLPAAMRKHFELVFCDLREWVPTPAGFDLNDITIEMFADDVEAMRGAAGLERPIVMGHSHHGGIALEYARIYPDAARGIAAVASTPPVGASDDHETIEEFFRRDASPERRAAHKRNLAAHPIPETITTSADYVVAYLANGAGAWYDPTFDAAPLWEGVELNMEVSNQLSSAAALGGFRLDRLDVPVFLALGRFDYGLPYFWWDEPRKRLANACYHLYEKSGHSPPYEQPDDFTADLVEWAKELS